MKTQSAKCPIKGCNLSYSQGILGWHKHVENLEAHPYWHPELAQAGDREGLRKAFEDEFPTFFANSATAGPRKASGTYDVRKLINEVMGKLVELERRTSDLPPRTGT